ncbi:hypothetical protein ACK3BE_32735 (plasmid) [Pseudomonas mandelii]|uniref:hypothetical protein n=1 Tax=Pseudomonas mandelii TaxID=75612 RepID=UPI00398D1DDD
MNARKAKTLHIAVLPLGEPMEEDLMVPGIYQAQVEPGLSSADSAEAALNAVKGRFEIVNKEGFVFFVFDPDEGRIIAPSGRQVLKGKLIEHFNVACTFVTGLIPTWLFDKFRLSLIETVKTPVQMNQVEIVRSLNGEAVFIRS